LINFKQSSKNSFR